MCGDGATGGFLEKIVCCGSVAGQDERIRAQLRKRRNELVMKLGRHEYSFLIWPRRSRRFRDGSNSIMREAPRTDCSKENSSILGRALSALARPQCGGPVPSENSIWLESLIDCGYCGSRRSIAYATVHSAGFSLQVAAAVCGGELGASVRCSSDGSNPRGSATIQLRDLHPYQS